MPGQLVDYALYVAELKFSAIHHWSPILTVSYTVPSISETVPYSTSMGFSSSSHPTINNNGYTISNNLFILLSPLFEPESFQYLYQYCKDEVKIESSQLYSKHRSEQL